LNEPKLFMNNCWIVPYKMFKSNVVATTDQI